ncbi:MAG: pilus assembly protein TadG-related protein [bacterium]|nr:pilus assembly protein TadG-related protein [bacterium]
MSSRKGVVDLPPNISRRGAIAPLSAISIVALIGFVAFGVDIGFIAYQKQRMQIACDAAALAAAMEITHAVEQADAGVGDVQAYALDQARQMAAKVASMNGHYIDPTKDVQFGRRDFDANSNSFKTTWGKTPANVIKVACRRDNPDATAPDARVPTFFAHVLGNRAPDLRAESIATVESRDIISVLDFSRSMNFDSYFNSEASVLPPQSQIETNLRKVWDDLGNPSFGNMPFEPDWVTIPSANWGNDLTVRWESEAVTVNCESNLTRVYLEFNNGGSEAFSTSSNSGTWQGTGSNSGQRITTCWVRRGSSSWEEFDFYNNATIKRGLGLSSVPYPWQRGSWDQYISMARDTSGSFYDRKIYDHGYRRKFGIMTFMHYVLRWNSSYNETADLWKTRHYPFHSMKIGQEMFCQYLDDLDFNDYVGLVSYDTSHRIESTMSGPGMPTVDISAEPVTNNYQAVKNLIHYKQASHYSNATNMGGGLKDAKQLLDQYGREGARGTILLITDGNANTIDSGDDTSLPAGWNWDALFDYDKDGSADFTADDENRIYVLKKAKECADAGYTIHTMSVGYDADVSLMNAIAHLGKGVYIEVPGNPDTEAMEADILDAFREIAALLPSATLLSPDAQ